MDSLGDSSWYIDAFELRNTVTLFILYSATLLPSVLGSLAVLSKLNPTLLSGDGLLDRSLSDLALTFLDVSTNCVRDTSTIFLSDGFISSLRNLIANLLGNLSTHRLRCNSFNWRRIEL